MRKLIRIYRPFNRISQDVTESGQPRLKNYGEATKDFIHFLYEYNKYFNMKDCRIVQNQSISLDPFKFNELYKLVLIDVLKTANYRNTLNIKESTPFDMGSILVFDTNPDVNYKMGEQALSISIGDDYNNKNQSLSLIRDFYNFDKLNNTDKIDNFFKFLKENIDYVKLEYLEDYEPIIEYNKK